MKLALKLSVVAILTIGSHVSMAQQMIWSQKANPLDLQINGMAFNQGGNQLLSGTNCHPASIRRFETTTGQLNWDYTLGSAFWCVMGVSISANGRYIAAIEEFGNLLLFEQLGSVPVIIDTIRTNTSYAFATAISPDNQLIAIGCSNGQLQLHNIADTSAVIRINNAHPNWVTTVCWAPGRDKVATGGSDNRVKVWNRQGQLLLNLAGHTDDISAVRISPDGNVLISASLDNRIRVWNLQTGALIRVISGHRGDVRGIDFSPDGTRMVSVSADSSCRIWDVASGTQMASFGVPDSGSLTAVAWSPLGNFIATGNGRSDVVMWQLTAANVVETAWSPGSLSVFPNPATEAITLAHTAHALPQQVYVIDALGRKTAVAVSEEQQMDIRFLPPGHYRVHFTEDRQIFTTNFIKY